MLDQWPCWLLCWGNIETPWSHSGLKVNITAVSSHSILIFIQTTGCTGYEMSEITEALKGFPNLDNVKIKGMKQEEWTKDWWGDKEKVHGEEGEREMRWWGEMRWDEMRCFYWLLSNRRRGEWIGGNVRGQPLPHACRFIESSSMVTESYKCMSIIICGSDHALCSPWKTNIRMYVSQTPSCSFLPLPFIPSSLFIISLY